MEQGHVPPESLQVPPGDGHRDALGVPEAPSRGAPAPKEPSALVQLSVTQPPHGGWTLVSPLLPQHRATATGVQEQVPCAASQEKAAVFHHNLLPPVQGVMPRVQGSTAQSPLTPTATLLSPGPCIP